MKMLRIVAAGAVSYLAYRAWKRNRDEQADTALPHALPDDGARTAPHGDPVLANDADAVRTSVQTGTGIGLN